MKLSKFIALHQYSHMYFDWAYISSLSKCGVSLIFANYWTTSPKAIYS